MGVSSWTGSDEKTYPCVCSPNTISVNFNSLLTPIVFLAASTEKYFSFRPSLFSFFFHLMGGGGNLTKIHAKCNVNLWKGRLGLVNIHHEGGGEGLVG